jgi:hypothetical protein
MQCGVSQRTFHSFCIFPGIIRRLVKKKTSASLLTEHWRPIGLLQLSHFGVGGGGGSLHSSSNQHPSKCMIGFLLVRASH